MKDKIHNRKQIIWKITFFLLLISLGIIYIQFSWVQARKAKTEEILQISKSIEILLPVGKIKALSAMPDDTAKPEYQDLKRILADIIRINSKARFAYLYIEKDSKILFLVDSEPEKSRDYSPPGQDFIEADQILQVPIIEKREVVTHPVTDRWGIWISVLIPVKDEASGLILAVFGMDYDARTMNQKIYTKLVYSSLIFIALLISVFLIIRIIEESKIFKTETDKQLHKLASIQESEALYRSLFDNMTNGFAYCKMLFDGDKPIDFIFLNVNKAFEIITDLKIAHDKKASEMVPAILEKDKGLLKLLGDAAITGKPSVNEIYLNFMKKWVMLSLYSPHRECFAVILEVITERKNMEEETRLNNFCLTSLLELNKMKHLTFTHLYLYTVNKCVELCRSEFGFLGFIDEKEENLKIYPSSSRELYHLKPWSKSITYGSGLTDVWDEVIFQRIPITANNLDSGQLLKKAPSLQLKNLKNYVGLPFIENDRVIAVLIICNKNEGFNYNDIKQLYIIVDGLLGIIKQRKYEDEVKVIKEKAEESDFLKTAFLQNMSHEIRTPMNAIIGFSDLLATHYNNKPKLEYYTGIIKQRSNDLLQIINDILDIARIETGQLNINIAECDLKLFFAGLLSMFKEHRKRLNKEHIDYNLRIDAAQDDFIILTDENKLKQIFVNLIGNAFKFTETGRIEGGYTIDENNNLVFFVSDTGIGIMPDKHQMIFDRFAKAGQDQSRLYGGTGLGLSIAKGLVKLLGGDIWLESEPGQGTTFYFNIAYKKSQTMPQETFIIIEPEEYYFPDKTVLIVEDDPDNAEFLKEILADKGLIILHTGFAKEAVNIAINQKIDMILMDINLPDMDGYEATRLIKNQKPEIKIIAQTAYAAQRNRSSAFEAGCDDYMAKPLKYEMLLAMMKKHFLQV